MTKLRYRFFSFSQSMPEFSGSGEEVDFVIFAIFSKSGHLGYSTWPNFIFLRP